jgi:hypothetical protein
MLVQGEPGSKKKRKAAKLTGYQTWGESQGRLPHGAVYLKTWDAEKGRWQGTLTIPGLPVFEGSETGSRKLESYLDGCYRNYLKAQAEKQESPPVAPIASE